MKKTKKEKNQEKQKIVIKKGFNLKREITKKGLTFFLLLMLVSSIVSFFMSITISYSILNEFDISSVYKGLLSSLLVSSVLAVLYFYLRKNNIKKYSYKNIASLFLVIFIVMIISTISQAFIHPFTVPILAATLCIAILMDKITALLTSTLLAVAMITLTLTATFDTVVLSQVIGANIIGIVTSAAMIFIIPRNATRFRLMWGNVAIAIVMFPLAFVFGIAIKHNVKEALFVALFNLLGNVLGIATFTGILPILEYLFKTWTNLKFSEVSSFDQPILRKLAKEAPGTFQHSLAVGNMAELCAIAIGENPYIARVSGYYHDVGKLRNPEYFIENQTDGQNPHNDLIPDVSVKIITRHTVDGYNILRDIGMPEEISRVALEHHGTSKVLYFYNKAQSYIEGSLDENPYRYENPTPTSKISAIITICDVVEATARSRKMTYEEMKKYIRDLIKLKINENQFVECDITLKELDIICETLINIAPSIRHTRIDYTKKEY